MSKKTDGRSLSSKANIRKAQSIRAKKQGAEKKAIQAYKKKIRGGDIKIVEDQDLRETTEDQSGESEDQPVPRVKAKAKPPKKAPKKTKKLPEPDTDSDTSSSDEELVISSRKISKARAPKVKSSRGLDNYTR